jgi:HK97 family phage prohead protease
VRVQGGEGEPSKIVGYAAVFDSETEIFPGFKETVRRGAFSKTIREADVVALFNHDPSIPLARRSAGSLRLQEDNHGLLYEADLDRQDPDALRVIRKIETKTVIGSSFQFQPVKAPAVRSADGQMSRDLLEVKLIDVGPVTFAAYADTSAQIRSWQDSERSEHPEVLVEILRGEGLTDLELRATLLAAVERVNAPEPPEVGHSAHQIDLMSRALDFCEMAS